MKINLNLQDINIIPVTSNIKKYHRLSLDDKYFCIKQLFYQGYSETTIYLAHDFLKNNYSQEVHMTLIESYFRAQIFEQFESQLEKFIEGLLFDYLSTELQIKFFWYLQKIYSLGMTQKFYIDFNIDQQLLQRTSNIIKKEKVFEKLDKQFKQYENSTQPRDYIVNELLYLFSSDKQSCECDFEFHFMIISYLFKLYPLDIIVALLEHINLMQYFSYDINQRISNNYEIAEICILLNRSKGFKKQLKIINKQIFLSESCQQNTSFKILLLIIQIQRYSCYKQISQKQFDDLIEKLFIQLSKISFITFHQYKINISQMIKHFLKITTLYSINSKNGKLLSIVEQCIQFDFNQFKNQINIFKQYHSQVQHILLALRNYNRCQKILAKYRNLLDFEPEKIYVENYENKINLELKPSLRMIQSTQNTDIKLIQQAASSVFLFNRYLN